MLKRLRIKFIALNMSIVAAVLILTFSAVCVLDYQQSIAHVTEELDATLERIIPPDNIHHQKKGFNIEWFGFMGPNPAFDIDNYNSTADTGESSNQETFIGSGEISQDRLTDEDASTQTDVVTEEATNDEQDLSEGEGSAPTDRESALPPRIGGFDEGKSLPVATYILRDGYLMELTKHSTAAIDEAVLTQAAEKVADVPDGHGELADLGLFYAKRTIDNEPYIAFADASAANSWQSVAWILAAVGLVTLLVFFVISVFFSRWALAPVARTWEKQRRFVADASHDLKTPLTVILANSSILEEHPEKTVADQMQWIESTQHEALSMQGLVNDLLTLARVDEAEANPQASKAADVCEHIDFSDLVEGELLQMESLAFEHGISFTSSITPNLFVCGKTVNLRRMVTTLVDNACKYAGSGESVSVTLTAVSRKAVLKVHNTGTPIDQEDLPHIFDRFYRADKARNRNDIGGHGLGLAIAQALAEEIGGSITAQSTEADGTTFTLTLPLG